MKKWSSAVPALVAALLIALLPACGMSPARHSGPIENPHGAARVAPRDADIPVRIQRTAGEFCPPSISAGGEHAWALALVYVFVLIGYCIGWCFYSLGELIYEAINEESPDGDE